MKSLLKISEAAEIYKISKSALYKAVQKEELINYSNNKRMYLLNPSEIDEWVKTAKIRRPIKFKIRCFHEGKEITKEELIELLKQVNW